MKRAIPYTAAGLLLLLLTLAATGCGSVNQILRSNDPELIYSKALEFYGAEKWTKASTLLESIGNMYGGTSREDSIAFFNARCKFKSHDYMTAGELLDQFRRRYGRSAFIEDAEGMYVLCFYNMAPGPTRDQTVTVQARTAIAEFISRYPQSEHVGPFREIDAELLQRLYDKAFYNAFTYYKIGRYKSAIVALRNALKEYPESNHREEIMYYVVVSSYKLAENSVSDKQTDRYLSTLDSYYSFIDEYPESGHRKELDRYAREAKDFLATHQQTESTES